MTDKIKTIKTEQLEMDYFHFGNGHKTFIILPGLSLGSVMASCDQIAEAYQTFAQDYTVYVFDRRKDMPHDYDISQMAEDTYLAMRQLGLHDLYLFGASQGGMMAMEIAIHHPEAVKMMVLGSTAAAVGKASLGSFKEMIGLAEAGSGEELYLSFGKAVYPQDVFDSFKETMRQLGKGLSASDYERFIICAKALEDFDIRNELGKIGCPTLIISSATDQVLDPSSSHELHEMIKGSELHVYEGYGHAAYDLAPDYKQRIIAFFDSNN